MKKASKGDLAIMTLTFFLELTSCLDYIGDVIILKQFFGKHPAWFTLSVYFMISPFLVSYVPLINFQIQAYKTKERTVSTGEGSETSRLSFTQGIIAWASKSPALIIYLIFMDFIFIMQSMFIRPFIVII